VRHAGDLQVIVVGAKQEEAAIEERYEVCKALNKHESTEWCEPGQIITAQVAKPLLRPIRGQRLGKGVVQLISEVFAENLRFIA
jgi:hypothetical protein